MTITDNTLFPLHDVSWFPAFVQIFRQLWRKIFTYTNLVFSFLESRTGTFRVSACFAKALDETMQRERQEEIEHEDSMEENAGPLLISKLEVQHQ